MQRQRRVKVRLSENELNDLHMYAERHHSSVAGLLRDSVLNEENSQRVFIGMEDIQEFTRTLSAIDTKIELFIALMQDNIEIYREDILRIRDVMDSIDNDYGDIRRMIWKKRQKVAKAINGLLKKSELSYIEEEAQTATTVTLSDEEYDKLKSIAEKEERPLSVCMKVHAFSICTGACYTVESDSLKEFNIHLKQKLRFITAIYTDTASRFVEAEDVDNVLSILREIHLEMIRKTKSVDEGSIHQHAKEIVRGATWQL